MQTIEYRTIDKSSWPRGEWDNEPDKVQWQDAETGLPCLVVRGPHGAWCGYVGVAKGHPYYEQDYDKVHDVNHDLSVHGGLTFASKCHPAPNVEHWQKWRKRAAAPDFLAQAKRYPTGDAANFLRDRAKELESYEAYVEWSEAALICHKVETGEDGDIWWLGFDCAHAGDYSPGYQKLEWFVDHGDEYRNWAWVTQETKSLAQQLKAVK